MLTARGAGAPARLPIRTLLLVTTTETRFPSRIAATAFSAVLQIAVLSTLWTAVYCGADGASCDGAEQARTYSALAVLTLCTRGAARDSVRSKIREGTLVFWFVRPMAPQRYLALRTMGGFAYNLMWLVPGAALLVLCGVISPPASWEVLVVALWCLAMGQIVAYQLGMLLELLCFWTISNYGITRTYFFFQDLLSGAVIPLWLFSESVQDAVRVLPFHLTVDLPIVVYQSEGIDMQTAHMALSQLAWAVGIGCLTRFLWVRAARRVPTDGG